MNKIDTFLKNRIVKIISNCLIPIVIGALFSAIGSWNFKNDKFIWYKIISVALFTFIYLFCLYRYNKIDESFNKEYIKIKDENKKYKKQTKAYSKVTLALTSLFNTSADAINVISNNLMSNTAKLDNWNYKIMCTGICNGIYETICLITGSDDFSVNIVVYDTKAKGKSKNIKMIADKSKYETHPDTFEEKIYMSSHKDFFAVKMFNKNSPEITILTTGVEVKEKFVFSEDKTDHPNYSQYIGVPIHCSGKQMISLLQICAFNDSKIESSKEQIMGIVNRYILPFTYFALLNNKIEKGFINSISLLEKDEQHG